MSVETLRGPLDKYIANYTSLRHGYTQFDSV